VAVVTGAGRGIGAALAAGLAGAGAHVALADVDEAAARARAGEITAAGGRAFGLHVDVADAAAVDRMVRVVVEHAGGLDVLVNNAGIVGPVGALETGEEDWDRVMRVNARGVFLCARRAAVAMRGRGGAIMRGFAELPEVEVAAICDVDSNVFASAVKAVEKTGHKPEVFGDYRKLLERKDIDAVVASVPDHWHALITMDACRGEKTCIARSR